MRNYNYLKFGMFLLVGVLLLGVISADYARSEPRYVDFSRFSDGVDFDSNSCRAGTDFLLQISPFGCTPTIVRSDLLAEQNVPVFCQIGATQINPLIKVDAIDSINFDGEYPSEVQGIGFHPANAALGTRTNLNSPVLNNVGYAVIVLKQQKNISALPEVVSGNLTARIKYDIENALGIGRSTFILPELSDSEWEDEKLNYGFWNGLGYLRAKGIGADSATIVLEDDVRQLSSVSLTQGKNSRRLSMPGLECQAGLNLRLDGVVFPDTRVRLRVGNDVVDLVDEQKFLDNRCTIKSIDKSGLVQKVKINCKEDREAGGSNSFWLTLSPRVNLDFVDPDDASIISGKPGGYEVGDLLYTEEDGEKSVYLGYIGERVIDGEKQRYIIPVKSPVNSKEEFIDTTLFKQLDTIVKGIDFRTGSLLVNLLTGTTRVLGVSTATFSNFLITGSYPVAVIYEGENYEPPLIQSLLSDLSGSFIIPLGKVLEGFVGDIPLEQKINFVGLAGAQDVECDSGDSGEVVFNKLIEERNLGSLGLDLNGDGKCFSNWEFDPSKCSKGDFVIVGSGNEAKKYEKEGENDWRFEGEFLLDQNIKSRIIEITVLNIDGNQYEGTLLQLVPSTDNEFDNLLKKEDLLGEGCQNIRNAQSDYQRVHKDFANSRYPLDDRLSLGERAMVKEIQLLFDTNQKRSMLELCDEFREEYPRSNLMTSVDSICRDEVSLSSLSVISYDATINSLIKRITLLDVFEPSYEEYGAELVIVSSEDKESQLSGTFQMTKGESRFMIGDDMIELIEVQEDYVRIKYTVAEPIVAGVGSTVKPKTVKLEKDEFLTNIGKNKYRIGITNINLERLAKVSILPSIENAGTVGNFSFRVSIEKSDIELNPKKTKRRIDNLNETIADWEEKSEKIGNVVKGLKGACLATGATLTVKNFLTGALGSGTEGIARRDMMRDVWYPFCESNIGNDKDYDSMDSCLADKAQDIEESVGGMAEVLDEQNEWFKENRETTKSGFLGEERVTGYKNDYEDRVIGRLENADIQIIGREQINLDEGSDVIKYFEDDKIDVNSAKFIERDLIWLENNAGKKGEPIYESIKGRVHTSLLGIQVTNKGESRQASLRESLGIPVHLGVSEKTRKYSFEKDIKYSSVSDKFDHVLGLSQDDSIQYWVDVDSSREYLLKIDEEGVVQSTYLVNGRKLTEQKRDNPFSLKFDKRDADSYSNEYKNAQIKYYENEPYKGRPALVPFDEENGWYVSIVQKFGGLGSSASLRSYDDSGAVRSYWLCNVGPNGLEQTRGGDDICQLINVGIGQPRDQFPGLDSAEAEKLIGCAGQAIEQASRIRDRTGSVSIRTSCGSSNIKIGDPAIDLPEIKCADIMPVSECNLLYNVCDPVICPSSRCDFGGTFPVRDVVQSGIVGSTLLCLPNAGLPSNGGVVIPVCLTGIQAGIDGWTSILTSHRDCLQENLETGELTGICDEMYSLHSCEFFWRQGLPLSKIIIPSIFERIVGQTSRGGGEYLGVQQAFTNAQDSFNFFTNFYAENAWNSFRLRTAEDFVSAGCKGFVSARYPEGASLADAFTDPDSPPQYHGRLDEIPFTSATVPPVSQYKVFYHIYAGKDRGANYRVYLKGAPEVSYFQDVGLTRVVASGFVGVGGTESETKDFTAPAGYRELCISVNGQEECGFKQTSTSFAVDYINDKFIEEQAKESINSEKQCVSGSASIYSVLNPSLQGAGEEILNPAVYNRGLIRVCSSESPGKGSDPQYNTNDARWKDVGFCGDANIRCWLDSNSVKDVIQSSRIEAETLEGANELFQNALQNSLNISSTREIESEIVAIESDLNVGEWEEVIRRVSTNLKVSFFNYHKAYLYFLRGQAYSGLAGFEKAKENNEKAKAAVVFGDEGEGEISEEELTEEEATEIGEGEARGQQPSVDEIEEGFFLDTGNRIRYQSEEVVFLVSFNNLDSDKILELSLGTQTFGVGEINENGLIVLMDEQSLRTRLGNNYDLLIGPLEELQRRYYYENGQFRPEQIVGDLEKEPVYTLLYEHVFPCQTEVNHIFIDGTTTTELYASSLQDGCGIYLLEPGARFGGELVGEVSFEGVIEITREVERVFDHLSYLNGKNLNDFSYEEERPGIEEVAPLEITGFSSDVLPVVDLIEGDLIVAQSDLDDCSKLQYQFYLDPVVFIFREKLVQIGEIESTRTKIPLKDGEGADVFEEFEEGRRYYVNVICQDENSRGIDIKGSARFEYLSPRDSVVGIATGEVVPEN